jgi:hypothetical protein
MLWSDDITTPDDMVHTCTSLLAPPSDVGQIVLLQAIGRPCAYVVQLENTGLLEDVIKAKHQKDGRDLF